MAIVAQMLHDYPREAIDYLVYPQQNPANKAYILNQLDSYTNLLLDTGKQYFDQAKDLYEKINNSETVRAAKAALRMAKGIMRPNVITELQTTDDIRSAQPIMQRYIMAQPDIRKLYHEQRCDGYEGQYIDAFPNILGSRHEDFMAVMSGMIDEFVDEKGDDTWKTTMYAFDSSFDDAELTVIEKVDILHTWEIVKLAIEAKLDPTDVWGGNL